MGDSINLGISVMNTDSMSHAIDRSRTLVETPTNADFIREKNLDRKGMKRRIQEMDLDEDVKKMLLKKLMQYPDGAVKNFWQNISNTITTLNLKKQKGQI